MDPSIRHRHIVPPCLIASLVVLTILIPAGSQAQTAADALRFTQRFPGVGVQVMGMGGAGIAGTGDVGAFFANPAGLGYIDQTLLTGTVSTLIAQDDATYKLGQFQSAADARGSRTAPGSVNYLYKVPTRRGALVLGGGYNQTYGFTRSLAYEGQNDRSSITDFFMPLRGEFEIDREPGPDGTTGTEDDLFEFTWFRDLSRLAFETYAIDFDESMYESGDPIPFYPAVTRGTVTQRDDVVEEGRTGELSLGGAIEAFRDGMMGLSLNVITGSYGYDRIYEEVDSDNDNDGTGLTTDFEALEYITAFETDLVGLNLRGGLSTELTEHLRLGVTLETPTYYSASESYSTRIQTFFDNGDTFEFGGEPTDPGSGEYDYSITTPWRFGLGASVNFVGLHITGDVTYVDWAQMQLSAENDQGYYDDVNREIGRNYAAVWPYRIGAEYDLGALALRAGYAFQPYAGIEQTGVDRDRTYYTGGIAYRVSSDFTLEGSWMHERFEDQYTPYTDVDGVPTVAESVFRNFVTVGVKIGF